MTVLDTLFLALGIDTKGIDKGLAQAQQKIDAGARSLANSLMSPFKAALGALAAGLSLGAVTKQYLQQADAIGKMADSIGADMEELQAWGEASARAGGSAEAFKGTVQGMTRSLQMAANGAKGPAAQALQQLGVRATDASGKARDTFDVLRDLAGVMEGMDKQKAMGLGQRMGLDRGTIMLLQSGRAAVDDLVARQKELGVYTKEDAEIAAKANDAIADLGQSLKAAAAIVMRAIVPAITWVTEHLTALVQDFRKHKTFYLAALGAIAAFLTAKMIPTLVKVGLLNARIWAPYAVLAALISGLALVFDDLWVYMHGGQSALEDYWATLGTGPELLEKFNKAWESVKNVGQRALDTLLNIAKTVFDFFVRNIDAFILTFEGLWDVIEGLFNFDFQQIGRGLAKTFTGAWDIIQSVFKDIFSGMKKMSIWDGIANGAKLAWDTVKALATGFFEGLPPEAQKYLQDVWNAFLSFVRWDELKALFKWDDIKQAAFSAWNGIKNISKTVFDFIQEKIQYVTDHWDDIKNAATTAWNGIKTVAKEVLEYLSGKLEYISGIVDGLWTSIGGLFNFDFKKIGEGLGQAFNSAYRFIASIFDDILGWFGDLASGSDNTWETISNAAKSAWDNLTAFAKGFFSQLDPELQKAIQTVGVFAAAWAIEKTISGIIGIGKEVSGLKNLVSGLFNLIKLHPIGMIITALGLIIVYWDDIKAAAQKFFNKLSEWAASAGEWLSGVWDNFLTKTKEIWENVKTTAEQKWNEIKASAEAMWEGIKQQASNIWENIKNTVTTKMTALWESLKSIFKWETWETAFAGIFEINFEELGQKIAKLFSWDEWKKAFADIFNFVPDFSAIKTALTNVFNEAVKWLKETFPWLFSAIEAVTGTAKQAGNVVKQYASDSTEDDEERGTDTANRFQLGAATQPSPADNVSSQAAAAAVTNNETTNNVKQDDNRTFNFTFTGVPNDPNSFFNTVKGPLSRDPGWMSQAATTMAFGGNS